MAGVGSAGVIVPRAQSAVNICRGGDGQVDPARLRGNGRGQRDGQYAQRTTMNEGRAERLCQFLRLA